MKSFSTVLWSVLLTFFSFTTNASDWELMPYSIGTVLDQTEMNDDLYLVTLNEIYQDPVTYTTLGGSYSIHRFDGSTMNSVVTFECAVENGVLEMNIQGFQNKLYIGGSFQGLNGDTTMNYITCFENGSFHQVAGGMLEVPNGGIRDMELYNNTLLVSGCYRLVNFTYPSSYHCDFITTFTGSLWVKFGNDEFSYWCYVTCLISKITIDGNDVIVVGEFDRIGTIEVHSVARYSNGTWFPMTNSGNYYWSPGVVVNQGNYYNIRMEFSPGMEVLNYLDKWDGTSWQPIKLICKGAMTNSLINYNDQLFISGDFSYNDPSMENIGILNTTTGDITPSFNADADGMEAFNPGNLFLYKSTLYSVNAYGGYPGAQLPSLAVYQKEERTTSIHPSQVDNVGISFYPNPASESLYLQGDLTNTGAIQILDIAGKVKLDFPGGYSGNIPVNELSAGTYILKIEKEGNYTYQNFIKN